MYVSNLRTAKSSILYGLIVLVVILAADRAAAAIMRVMVLHSDDRAARIYAGGRKDDVVIVGASVAGAMANPVDLSKQTHKHVFTMAIHGLDPVTQDALVRDYLERNAPPRIALIDVRSARGESVKAQTLSLFAGPETHLGQLLAQNRDSLVPWSAIFHLYRFNSPILPKTIQNIVMRNDQTNGASDGRITPAIIAAWQRNKIEHVSKEEATAFAAMIDAFRKAGTTPVIIEAPMHQSGRYQVEVMKRDVVARLPAGILVCDFTDLLNEDKDFEDPAHLNATGREVMAPVFDALIDTVLGETLTASDASRAVTARCAPSAGLATD